MKQVPTLFAVLVLSSAVYAATPNQAFTVFGYFPLIAAVTGIAVVTAVVLYNSPGTRRQTEPPVKQGREYLRLTHPQPTSTATDGRIEVVEVFSYSDPKSYRLSPLILRWAHELEDSVELVRVPITAGERERVLAKAYYAAQNLSVAELLHGALFDAIHISRRDLGNEHSLAQFFSDHGIDTAAFHGAFNASSTVTATQKARLIVKGYGIDAAPAYILNGTYLVTERLAGSEPRLLETLDYLVKAQATTD